MGSDHTALILFGYATAALIALGVYLLNRWDERARRLSRKDTAPASGQS